MAYTAENGIEFRGDKAIELVAALPRTGQIAKDVYISKHPTSDGRDKVVKLTAVREGAARLAEDASVQSISLVRNPNIIVHPKRGWAGADILRVAFVSGEGLELPYIAEATPNIPEDRRGLVQTVLGNISELVTHPLREARGNVPALRLVG